MKNEDIIGKKFIAFKFNNTKHLSYSSQYEESFGKEAEVLNLHADLPYAYCSIKIRPTTTIQNYYPIEMIIEQLEEENRSIDEIIIKIKQLISTL